MQIAKAERSVKPMMTVSASKFYELLPDTVEGKVALATELWATQKFALCR